MRDQEKPLSPAMISALQAVARMKGDSILLWPSLLAEMEHDDRVARSPNPTPNRD